MSSSLSRIPAPKRRQLAATLGLFSVLFIAVGAVAETGATTGVVQAFVFIALFVAVVLALMAWGVAHSMNADRADLAEKQLDDAIEQAVRARGGQMCDCGHEHDPTELHVTDDPCAADGHGVGCTHSCETCVLATMRPNRELVGSRPSPATADQQARPRPTPKRPSPTPR